MDERSGNRPKIIIHDFVGTEDPLLVTGQQAQADQWREAAADRLKGESGEEIYAAAKALIGAQEFLGMRRGKSPQDTTLDTERIAFGISMNLGTENLDLRKLGVEGMLLRLQEKATNATRRRYLDENVIPVLYRIHGISPE